MLALGIKKKSTRQMNLNHAINLILWKSKISLIPVDQAKIFASCTRSSERVKNVLFSLLKKKLWYISSF